MNKVYIVIVNYTKYKDTIECLESVLKLTYSNFQILLIDNSPDYLSYAQLKDWSGNQQYEVATEFNTIVYPLVEKPVSTIFFDSENEFRAHLATLDAKIVVIKAQNRGFAAANNIALAYINEKAEESSFIWILNNDVVVEKNCLKNLVSFFDSHDLNHIVGSKLRFYYKPQLLQAVAGRYNKWLGSTYHIGEGEVDAGQYDDFKLGENNYIVGASMFIPKLFLTKVGLMTEDFFLYYEELDWVLRGKKQGFGCALQSNAIVYHKEGTSIIGSGDAPKRDTSMAEFYSIVNRVKISKKWFKKCLPTVLLGVLFALTKRLTTGKAKLAKEAGSTVLNVLFS